MACRLVLVMWLVWTVGLAACTATPPGRLAVVTPRQETVVAELDELRVPLGVRIVVYRRDGEVVAGRLRGLDATGVQLEPEAAGEPPRVVSDAEIQRLGVVVGRTRPARAWIGFLTGAVLSLPLSISMVGDAVLVVGGLGAWAGSATGDARVELRLDRP